MVARVVDRQRRSADVVYFPRGAARDLLTTKDGEALIEGPAGTGKSYACLWKLHFQAAKYPRMRALMVRKTLTSLTSSVLVTFTERVVAGNGRVAFFGGNKVEPAAFRYANGSRIVVGGMDKATKIMSAEYDVAYVNEATELTEGDWESITSRLRYGVMPYQQIIADCNPDAPTHWLNQRANAGKVRRLLSRHKDNPQFWDDDAGDWTEQGREYVVNRLGKLTGVRRERLLEGRWAQAEGAVYESWDPKVHLIDSFPIPLEWPRFRCVDFGYVNAFVCQWWALDPDGRLYRYREIYRTGRLVEEHCADIKRLSAGEPRPRADITDHDAEDRATYEKHLGVRTTPAKKDVSPGIQAVASRLKPAGDGKPRIFFLRDALVERDPALMEQRAPACTEEEFGDYVWDTSNNRKRGEEPVKRFDHGMDTTRYMVGYFDLRENSGRSWVF